MNTDKKRIVILAGPPGSGKGTQALWLENESKFFHLESSAVIREQFAEHPNDPLIIQQKAKVESGDIVDPPTILEWMRGKITDLAEQGKSIVLSGSPRSEFEAAGNEQTQGLIPLFEQFYGEQNIYMFYITITEEEALRRAGTRRVCVAHDHPIPDLPEYRARITCPWDGSALQRRTDGLDDHPEIIQKRYHEYLKRIEPILAYMRKRGYTVVEIDGAEQIEEIHHKVIEVVERHRLPVPEN